MKIVYESSYLEMPIFNFYDSIECITILLITFYLVKSSPKGKKYIIFFASIFLLMISYGIYEKYKVSQEVEYAFNHKSYMVTEGIVDKLDPMPKGGHKIESFKVNDILFKISYTGDYPNEKSLLYTLTKHRNGPIQRNGQYVKIYYILMNGNNEIIKMYIEDEDRNKNSKTEGSITPRSHVARGNAYSTPNYQKRSKGKVPDDNDNTPSKSKPTLNY